MGKKDERREVKLKEGICPHCGYDCHDKESLQRHIEWVHKKEEKYGKSTGISRPRVDLL